MRYRRLILAPLILVLLVVGSVGCRSQAPKVSRAERLVLVSYDGVGADLAWSWIEEGVAGERDGLRTMARQGLSARRLHPVSPTLTAVNHVSLISGGYPAQTGIVSNYIHRPGTPITETVPGFNGPIDRETLPQLVRRNGGRVGNIIWPGLGCDEGQTYSDFGLCWPVTPLLDSEVVELDPKQAATTGEVPSHDEVPPLLWRLGIEVENAQPARHVLLVAAVDSNPDGRPRYDTVTIKRGDSDEWLYLGERDWVPVTIRTAARGEAEHTYGAWCKTLRIDRYRGKVRFYRGPFYRLLAYPEELSQRLEEEVGFWPGQPDKRLVGEWWLDGETGIDLDTFLEQIVRLDRYLDDVARWVSEHEEYRLLLVYHPTPDEYQHSSLIENEAQWAYTPGCAVAAREGLKQVGRSVDASVAALWRSLNWGRDALVVVSDHGLVPLADQVHINQVLAEAGLVELDGNGRVAPTTPMLAHSSGGCSHLFVNQMGRERGGTVAERDAPDLLRRAARALADLEQNGAPVVEKILTRSEAASLGLDHPHSGDLVVFLRPGFTASNRVGADKVIMPTSYYAQHGYLAEHSGMDGMLFARGGTIGRKRWKEARVTDVAGLVASWLGLDLSP